MKALYKRIAFLVLGFFLTPGLTSPCLAQETALFDPPAGFWLQSTDKSKPLYGASRQTAQWTIAQWNIPGDDLPPLQPSTCRIGSPCVASRTASLSVEIAPGSDGTVRYAFAQDGATLPCLLRDGRTPVEFNALAATSVEQQARNGSEPPEPFALGELTSLRHRVKVEAMDPSGPAEAAVSRCERNMAQLLTAVVLRNDSTTPKQIIFYQLRLFKALGKPLPFWWWRGEKEPGQDGKIQIRKWGFGDNLSTYGVSDPNVGEQKQIDIDLLPRLKELIATAPGDLDRDLSRWHLRSTYHGQSIWGDVRLRSEWSGFSMTVRLNR